MTDRDLLDIYQRALQPNGGWRENENHVLVALREVEQRAREAAEAEFTLHAHAEEAQRCADKAGEEAAGWPNEPGRYALASFANHLCCVAASMRRDLAAQAACGTEDTDDA